MTARGVQWRTSSRSYGGTACVEAAVFTGFVAVRDSKQPHGTQLRFTPDTWREFLRGLR